MTLFQNIWIFSGLSVAILILLCGIFKWLPARWCEFLVRNSWVNFFIFSVACLWFLYKILHLGEADLGAYKNLLFVGFLALFLLSLRHNYGFLGVRGLAGLGLLWSNSALNYTMGLYSNGWIVAKIGVYFIILACLYLAIFPYRFRDFLKK